MMGGNSEDRKSEVENISYSGCPYLKLCKNKKRDSYENEEYFIQKVQETKKRKKVEKKIEKKIEIERETC